MLREAWALAIETLSCIELRRMGERLALTQATKKLKIKDPRAIGLAHRLITETLRKKNFIDHLLNLALVPQSLNEIKVNVRAFLQIYVNETKFSNATLDDAAKIARMGAPNSGLVTTKRSRRSSGKNLKPRPRKLFEGS